MAKYKVGDKVRVRDDLIKNESYNGFTFINSMLEMKGREATIKEVIGNFYHIEEMDCAWTDDMLEPIFNSNIIQVPINMEVNNLNELVGLEGQYLGYDKGTFKIIDNILCIVKDGRPIDNCRLTYCGQSGVDWINKNIKKGSLEVFNKTTKTAGIDYLQKGNTEMNNPKSLSNTDKVIYSKLTDIQKKAYKNNLIYINGDLTNEGNSMILENMTQEEKDTQLALVVDILESVNKDIE